MRRPKRTISGHPDDARLRYLMPRRSDAVDSAVARGRRWVRDPAGIALPNDDQPSSRAPLPVALHRMWPHPPRRRPEHAAVLRRESSARALAQRVSAGPLQTDRSAAGAVPLRRLVAGTAAPPGLAAASRLQRRASGRRAGDTRTGRRVLRLLARARCQNGDLPRSRSWRRSRSPPAVPGGPTARWWLRRPATRRAFLHICSLRLRPTCNRYRSASRGWPSAGPPSPNPTSGGFP